VNDNSAAPDTITLAAVERELFTVFGPSAPAALAESISTLSSMGEPDESAILLAQIAPCFGVSPSSLPVAPPASRVPNPAHDAAPEA
jgi:hypothetical protein